MNMGIKAISYEKEFVTSIIRLWNSKLFKFQKEQMLIFNLNESDRLMFKRELKWLKKETVDWICKFVIIQSTLVGVTYYFSKVSQIQQEPCWFSKQWSFVAQTVD